MRTVVFAFVTLISPAAATTSGLASSSTRRSRATRSPPAIRSVRGAGLSTATATPRSITRQHAGRRDRARCRLRGTGAFATAASGQVVAAKVGTANVRCSAPSLALVHQEPEQVTDCRRSARARDHPPRSSDDPGRRARWRAVPGVRCVRQPGGEHHAGDRGVAERRGHDDDRERVTATRAGEYTVSCIVMGAANVEPADLLVMPALPASLTGVLDPERTLYAILDQVTVIATAFDRFGNRVEDVTLAYAASPTCRRRARRGSSSATTACSSCRRTSRRRPTTTRRSASRCPRWSTPTARDRLHADRRAERRLRGLHGAASAGDRVFPVRMTARSPRRA